MPGRGYGVRIEQPSLASDRETLIGYPVRITASVEPGRIHLTQAQYRSWLLAFAATAECTVRVSEALISIGVDDQ